GRAAPRGLRFGRTQDATERSLLSARFEDSRSEAVLRRVPAGRGDERPLGLFVGCRVTDGGPAVVLGGLGRRLPPRRPEGTDRFVLGACAHRGWALIGAGRSAGRGRRIQTGIFLAAGCSERWSVASLVPPTRWSRRGVFPPTRWSVASLVP